MKIMFFCRTGLLLACSRWVQSTIKQLFHALSMRTKQWTAVNKSLRHQEIRISPKKSWERRETNPGLVGEKRKRYLCGMPTPHETNNVSSRVAGDHSGARCRERQTPARAPQVPGAGPQPPVAVLRQNVQSVSHQSGLQVTNLLTCSLVSNSKPIKLRILKRYHKKSPNEKYPNKKSPNCYCPKSPPNFKPILT